MISLLLLLLAPAAHAEDPCAKLAALGPLVRTCSFNAAFNAAANACHAKLDRISSARGAGMGLSGGAKHAAQAGDLSAHGGNLGTARETLRALRADAARAREQLLEYRASMLRPGGISPALAAKLHRPFLDWLESTPCYSVNHAALTRSIGLFEEKIAQLDGALGDTSRLANSTGTAERHLASDSVAAPAQGTRASGAAVPARKSAGPSTITGATEPKKAR